MYFYWCIKQDKYPRYIDRCYFLDWECVDVKVHAFLGDMLSKRMDFNVCSQTYGLNVLVAPFRSIWAPAKTSDNLEQSHQDIDTWDYHETLRNDRGDTKNDDFWSTCLPDSIIYTR